MRVLIVHPKMDFYGGAELLIVRLANFLAQNHVEHALLTTNLSDVIRKDLKGTRVFSYPFRRLRDFREPFNLFRMIWLLHRAVNRHINEFDVINVHNYPSELSVIPCKNPTVWMCNEPPEVHVGFAREPKHTIRRVVISVVLGLEKRLIRRYVRHVVVADPFNAQRFENIYGFTPHIVNYGVDYSYFAEFPAENVTRRDCHQFIVLHVGMLTPQKRQLESLRAIDRLKDRIPGIRLVLAGSGEETYLSSLKDFIRSKKLETMVRFEGHVSRERVRELYHSSDVLIHPVGPQGGWLTPFEAIAAKLPVIVSKEMTASDLIETNHLGEVTDSYAQAIQDIYNNRSNFDEMAVKRSDWVRDHLSWDSFSQRLLAIFSRAVTDRYGFI